MKTQDEMVRVAPLCRRDVNVSEVPMQQVRRECLEKMPWPCSQSREAVALRGEEEVVEQPLSTRLLFLSRERYHQLMSLNSRFLREPEYPPSSVSFVPSVA